MVDDFDGCMEFIKTVGWPVIIKPDNGGGLPIPIGYPTSRNEKLSFRKETDVSYIMEEFIYARSTPMMLSFSHESFFAFETGNITPISIMDIVNNEDNAIFLYFEGSAGRYQRKAGRATVKSFKVKRTGLHSFEFSV